MPISLPDIHAAEKSFSMAPTWTSGPSDRLWFTMPLEIDGVTVEGLSLRAKAFKERADEAVMFQLDYVVPGRRDNAIDRIDWRPVHSHNNGGRGPQEYRYKRLDGSHHHSFELNWLGAEERMRRSNLPLAVPFIEPVDFRALVAFVGSSFRIIDAGSIRVPPWEKSLL